MPVQSRGGRRCYRLIAVCIEMSARFAFQMNVYAAI
jgi:hypothetical protein